MGGSSLAPEVMSLIFKDAGGLKLTILDSTDPAQVLRAAQKNPVRKTLYIVSSKSGGTAEVNAMLDYFWERASPLGAGQGSGTFYCHHRSGYITGKAGI